MMWKKKLTHCFSRAASSYHHQAFMQNHSAQCLITRMKEVLGHQPIERVWEIGCGTGLLTQHIMESFPQAQFLISDLSLPMVTLSRQSLGSKDHHYFAVMDGEDPCPPQSFDVICSNMTVQWFEGGLKSLERLLDGLRPKGWLCVSSLFPSSLQLWHQCQERLGLKRLAPDFFSASQYHRCLSQRAHVFIWDSSHTQTYGCALDFVRHLKSLGAHCVNHQSQNLTPGQLRALLAEYEKVWPKGRVQAPYDIALVLAQLK